MRIEHQGGLTYIEGTLNEEAKIQAWIEAAQEIDGFIQVAADESFEDEISLVIVRPHSTQTDRAEVFAEAKKRLKGAEA